MSDFQLKNVILIENTWYIGMVAQFQIRHSKCCFGLGPFTCAEHDLAIFLKKIERRTVDQGRFSKFPGPIWSEDRPVPPKIDKF